MKPLRLTAPTVSERLWPQRPLDAREVATWSLELRDRFYKAMRDERGNSATDAFIAEVVEILTEPDV
jgi:hypothetical protein